MVGGSNEFHPFYIRGVSSSKGTTFFKFMVDCQGIRYTHKLLELLAFEHSLIVQSYSPLLMFHHQELVRDAPWIGLGDNSVFFHDCWWFRNPAASRIDIPSLKLTQHLKICRNPKREVQSSNHPFLQGGPPASYKQGKKQLPTYFRPYIGHRACPITPLITIVGGPPCRGELLIWGRVIETLESPEFHLDLTNRPGPPISVPLLLMVQKSCTWDV